MAYCLAKLMKMTTFASFLEAILWQFLWVFILKKRKITFLIQVE